MSKSFKIGDRVIDTTGNNYGTGIIYGICGPESMYEGQFRVLLDNDTGFGKEGIFDVDQMELLSGIKEVKLSLVTEKVDNALWFEKTIGSDEAFKSKPGYALAAVVKVLLAKGVLTPSDFDLLTSEESAVTPVPANKD